MFLLGAGADICVRNADRATPLHAAASCDATGQCARALLAAGAPIEAVDVDGWTPLHAAAACTNVGAMQELLFAGANQHARDVNGSTPFHLARSAIIKLFYPMQEANTCPPAS
ncbi:hypothetical protein R5R35_013039 [Gryllus longicercus]|uniref:Uncharacterized protein n=1 Tax=Gryllus longicercus TaxID=2509291 RepID=A0AAN9VEV6_9ORTH